MSFTQFDHCQQVQSDTFSDDFDRVRGSLQTNCCVQPIQGGTKPCLNVNDENTCQKVVISPVTGNPSYLNDETARCQRLVMTFVTEILYAI